MNLISNYNKQKEENEIETKPVENNLPDTAKKFKIVSQFELKAKLKYNEKQLAKT